MNFDLQLRLLKPLLLHGADRQDFPIGIASGGLADSSTLALGLEDFADNGDSLSNVHGPQIPDLETPGSSSTDLTFLRPHGDLVRVPVDDSCGALSKPVEESGDGAAVNGAELIAVLSGELDAEGSDARHAVGGGSSGDNLHGLVERGIEVVRRSEREVGVAVGLKAGEKRVAGATRRRLG